MMMSNARYLAACGLHSSPSLSRSLSQGFSLVELLVVLVILAMLGGVVGPQVIKHLGRAKSDTARLQIEDFGAALDLFYLEVGRYPTTAEGLQSLVEQPGGVNSWNGPYLKKRVIPHDPWGQPYQFRSPGENSSFDIFSLGADNAIGGLNDARDIVSWE